MTKYRVRSAPDGYEVLREGVLLNIYKDLRIAIAVVSGLKRLSGEK